MGLLRSVALGVLTAIGISIIILFIQSVGNNNINTTSFQTTSINVITTHNSDSVSSTSQPMPTTTSSTTSTSTSTTTIITEAATPIWNEQLGVGFSQPSVSLAYNVTAVAQSDQKGCGPVYLLNGVSDKGYWYQLGLGYDWGCNLQGFWMIYEVFPPNDTSGNAATKGAVQFNGAVNPGDKVLIELLPDTNGTLIMQARDWNTGAKAEATYSFEGADIFIGSASYSHGYFSGLMTEWERPVPYYGSEQQVTYSEYGNLHMKGYLFAFGGGLNSTFTFSNNTSVPLLNATLSSDGTRVRYSNGTSFITGS